MMGRSIIVSSLKRENIAELAKKRDIWISKIDDGSPAYTDESWAFLAEVVRTTTSLEQLVFQRRTTTALQNKKVIDALVNDYRIKILDLWKAYCGDEGAKAVAAILKENSTIDFVRLGHNDIGVEGAKAIADALKVNKTLRHIDLSSNGIGIEGRRPLQKHSNITKN